VLPKKAFPAGKKSPVDLTFSPQTKKEMMHFILWGDSNGQYQKTIRYFWNGRSNEFLKIQLIK